MNLKLKRIAPLQAGKMLAAFYGLFALIFVPFMMIFVALGRFAAKAPMFRLCRSCWGWAWDSCG